MSHSLKDTLGEHWAASPEGRLSWQALQLISLFQIRSFQAGTSPLKFIHPFISQRQMWICVMGGLEALVPLEGGSLGVGKDNAAPKVSPGEVHAVSDHEK